MHVKQSVNYFSNWFLLTRFLWVKKNSKKYVFFQWLCKTNRSTNNMSIWFYFLKDTFLLINMWLDREKYTLYIESMPQSWKNTRYQIIIFESYCKYKSNRWKIQGFEFLNHVECVIRNNRFCVLGTSDAWHTQCHPILYFF